MVVVLLETGLKRQLGTFVTKAGGGVPKVVLTVVESVVVVVGKVDVTGSAVVVDIGVFVVVGCVVSVKVTMGDGEGLALLRCSGNSNAGAGGIYGSTFLSNVFRLSGVLCGH